MNIVDGLSYIYVYMT